MNHNDLTSAIRHLADAPPPTLTPLDIAEVRRVARLTALSGITADRDDIITAFVALYGPNPKVQSILRDALAAHAAYGRRPTPRYIRSTTPSN